MHTAPKSRSSKWMHVLTLLFGLVALVRAGSAQPLPRPKEPYLRPAIFGRLTDSATGKPAGRVGLRVRNKDGLGSSDSTGWYLFFDVPVGKRDLEFLCPSRRQFFGRVFARVSVEVGPATDSLLNIPLPLNRCVEPPLTSRDGEFVGHYRAGFEESRFSSCERLPELTQSFVGTAYEGMLRPDIWVTIEPEARSQVARWPTRGGRALPTYFVRWRGTLTGPGSYGHLGVSFFELRVKEILEVRAPNKTDCG